MLQTGYIVEVIRINYSMFIRVLGKKHFEMHYEVVGEGEPLLLVHGWSGNTEYFEPLIPELASRFQTGSIRAKSQSCLPVDSGIVWQSIVLFY